MTENYISMVEYFKCIPTTDDNISIAEDYISMTEECILTAEDYISIAEDYISMAEGCINTPVDYIYIAEDYNIHMARILFLWHRIVK